MDNVMTQMLLPNDFIQRVTVYIPAGTMKPSMPKVVLIHLSQEQQNSLSKSNAEDVFREGS